MKARVSRAHRFTVTVFTRHLDSRLSSTLASMHRYLGASGSRTQASFHHYRHEFPQFLFMVNVTIRHLGLSLTQCDHTYQVHFSTLVTVYPSSCSVSILET